MTLRYLYLTADQIGQENHGGGAVTREESLALKNMGGEFTCWGRNELGPIKVDPWEWSDKAYTRLFPGGSLSAGSLGTELDLTHIYAGTFTGTVQALKEYGCKVVYSAAAHDIDVSRREHEKLGIPYNYPHITDPELWKRYVGGYLNADAVTCPSRHSASVMERFGAKRVHIIPHGVHLPERTCPPPTHFTCGYLGSCGSSDKGVVYLLQAWKMLGYTDATLVLAGRDSTSDWVRHLVNQYGGGNIHLAGWQNSLGDFYGCISLYIQPSCTEGFGLEVLEAMAHGRKVLCSDGAGASDVVPPHWRFPACNAQELAGAIDYVKTKGHDLIRFDGEQARNFAKPYEWTKIRMQYQDLWRGLLK